VPQNYKELDRWQNIGGGNSLKAELQGFAF